MEKIDFENYCAFIQQRTQRLLEREVQVISLKNDISKPDALKICAKMVLENLNYEKKVNLNSILNVPDLTSSLLGSDEYLAWFRYAGKEFNIFLNTVNAKELVLYVPVDGELKGYDYFKQIRIETEWKYSLDDLIQFLSVHYWIR